MASPDIKRYLSNGPVLGAPAFGLNDGEIMHVKDAGDGSGVFVYTEDTDDPGKLIPTYMYIEDAAELITTQTGL